MPLMKFLKLTFPIVIRLPKVKEVATMEFDKEKLSLYLQRTKLNNCLYNNYILFELSLNDSYFFRFNLSLLQELCGDSSCRIRDLQIQRRREISVLSKSSFCPINLHYFWKFDSDILSLNISKGFQINLINYLYYCGDF